MVERGRIVAGMGYEGLFMVALVSVTAFVWIHGLWLTTWYGWTGFPFCTQRHLHTIYDRHEVDIDSLGTLIIQEQLSTNLLTRTHTLFNVQMVNIMFNVHLIALASRETELSLYLNARIWSNNNIISNNSSEFATRVGLEPWELQKKNSTPLFYP